MEDLRSLSKSKGNPRMAEAAQYLLDHKAERESLDTANGKGPAKRHPWDVLSRGEVPSSNDPRVDGNIGWADMEAAGRRFFGEG